MIIKKMIVFIVTLFVLCYAESVVIVSAPMAGESMGENVSIIFLHHSTGNGVWNGGMPQLFAEYNTDNDTNYRIVERTYPSGSPYEWKNYPFDYWNIWINHGGEKYYMEEPTLVTLTESYDVIVWKHCYPVSSVVPDTGKPDISSEVKSIENYKLQYEALKNKMHEYPDTRFVVWTGAALVKNDTNEEDAKRAKQFFDWVRTTWDEKGDNIFLWDFWELETEGGLYLKDGYASDVNNSHPNDKFNSYTAPLAVERIVDVIEGRGDSISKLGN